MKYISTILGILALVLIGVLFWLHFTHVEELKKVSSVAEKNAHSNFKIAYFDIDSLQAHYDSYQNALTDLRKKESDANGELMNLRARNQKRFAEIQQKGPTMSQTESEAANRELGEMERKYRNKESELNEMMQNEQQQVMTRIRGEIETYLSEFNKGNQYSYIFSYQPGFIIYYKDSAYDITHDLIEGLNLKSKTKKK